MKFISAVITVFLFQTFSSQNSYCQPDGLNNPAYRLIAHRGGIVDSLSAENSLPALEKAIAKKYWMVEIDLRLTADSVLITQHDRTFKRYFGVDSSVGSMTWERIKQLRSDTGSGVLSFEEVLQRCSGKIQVMIDNKISGLDTVLFGRVVALLKKYSLDKDALMIGTSASTEFFTGKIRLSCTRNQVEENMKRPGYDASDYYLFSGDISKEDVAWAKRNNIMTVGAINERNPDSEEALKRARARVQKMKEAGVVIFQIDSPFEVFFK